MARLRDRLLGVGGGDPVGDELEGRVLRYLRHLGIPKPGWLPLKAHLAAEHERLATIEGSSALSQAADVLYQRRFAAAPAPDHAAKARELTDALARSEKDAPASAGSAENAR